MWLKHGTILNSLRFLTLSFYVHEQISTLLTSLKYCLHRFANIRPQRWPTSLGLCKHLTQCVSFVNKYSIQEMHLLCKNARLRNGNVKQRPKYSFLKVWVDFVWALASKLPKSIYVTGRQRRKSVPTTSLTQCEPGKRRRQREQTNDCFSSVCRRLMEMQQHADTQTHRHKSADARFSCKRTNLSSSQKHMSMNGTIKDYWLQTDRLQISNQERNSEIVWAAIKGIQQKKTC